MLASKYFWWVSIRGVPLAGTGGRLHILAYCKIEAAGSLSKVNSGETITDREAQIWGTNIVNLGKKTQSLQRRVFLCLYREGV